MDMNKAFPSKYLKAADIGDLHVPVVMDRVEMEEVSDDEHRPVLYFRGKEKGLVLNRTNTDRIVYVHGADSDAWAGHELTLYTELVMFQGRSVPGLRVQVAQPQPASGDTEGDLPF